METDAVISPAVIDRLKALAGAGGWSDDPNEIAPLVTEWRDKYQGSTPLLLKPNTVEAIASIVETCNHTNTGIVPQGGNTGLVGGQVPDKQILLSLRRLNRVRNVD